MPKRKLFNPDESSPNVNSSVVAKMTPNRGGAHPALMSSKTPQSCPKKDNKTTKNTVNEANPKELDKNWKPDTVEDSDSDSLEVPNFFSSSNQKLPYSKDEDEIILKYVLKGQNIFRVSSISLWKQLEAKKENPRRTYQSLKNRFLRNIKPHMFSTYRHLIEDKTTVDRILSKFPELKHKMGKKETLSRIRLPERKLLSRPVIEGDGVSSTSTNDCQQIVESTAVQLALPYKTSNIHPDLSQSELVCSKPVNSVYTKTVIHPRTVKANDEGITVCVNLNLRKYVEIPSVGIYEKFQRLSRKNKLVFCSVCGRFNLPRKIPLKSSGETDIFIPNSVDTPRTPTKSLKKINLNSKSPSKRAKQRKVNSDPSCRSPCSPSLLKDVGESGELDKLTPDRTQRDTRVAQVEVSNSVTVRKDVSIDGTKVTQMSKCTESRSKIVRVTRGSSSGSRKEGNSRTGRRQRNSDDDVDSICEDTVTNFRELIDHEEEQQLVKKCLNKNYKSIGLEAVSQTNWDSYFLDSSSELGTPPLTIDYETDSQNNETTQSESTSSTPLAKNMKRMLRGRNKKS